MNVVGKFLRMQKEIIEIRSKPLLKDFHKVKFIFVGDDSNNSSKCTSLLGGFMVVIIAFEIWAILDLSYDCVSVAKVGQGRPKSKDCNDCLTSAILLNTNILGQVIGIPETKNRKAV